MVIWKRIDNLLRYLTIQAMKISINLPIIISITCLLTFSTQVYSQDSNDNSYTASFLLIQYVDPVKPDELLEITTTFNYSESTLEIRNTLHYYFLYLHEMINKNTYLMEDEEELIYKIRYQFPGKKRGNDFNISLITEEVTYIYSSRKPKKSSRK